MRVDDWRKYTCEFLGTFLLVFFAAGAVMVSAATDGGLGPIGAGIISGSAITIVIYAFGHVSGAHVNPALSIAAACLGRLDWRLVAGYIVAQMSGSALGGLTLLALVGSYGQMGANLPNEALGVAPATAFAIELVLSFVLMWVIAGISYGTHGYGSFAGLTIGGTVGIEVMLMGPYAGAAMNPARAFGPYLALGDFTHFWIYVVGPIFGMLAGAAAYRFTHAPARELPHDRLSGEASVFPQNAASRTSTESLRAPVAKSEAPG